MKPSICSDQPFQCPHPHIQLLQTRTLFVMKGLHLYLAGDTLAQMWMVDYRATYLVYFHSLLALLKAIQSQFILKKVDKEADLTTCSRIISFTLFSSMRALSSFSFCCRNSINVDEASTQVLMLLATLAQPGEFLVSNLHIRECVASMPKYFTPGRGGLAETLSTINVLPMPLSSVC
jgi:hypothetical protein